MTDYELTLKSGKNCAEKTAAETNAGGKALKARQIAFLFIAFLPVTKFMAMPKTAAELAGENLWIAVLINILIDLASIIALLFTDKFCGMTFYDLLESFGGTVFAKIILCLYFLFFLIKAFPGLIETSVFVQNTLYETSPTAFSFVPFFITAFYLCSLKLRAIGRLSDVLWLFTLAGFVIVMSLSFESADYAALLPILKNGKNVMKASAKISGWFSDSAYFLFMIGRFDKEKHSFSKIISGYSAAAVLILIFSAAFYAVFESLAPTELFPLAEISKFSSVINAVGRFDYLGIFMLILTAVPATALPVFFAARALKKVTGIKKTWITALVCILSEFVAVIIFKNYYKSISLFINEKLWLWRLLIGNGIPLTMPFIALAVRKKAKKGETRT